MNVNVKVDILGLTVKQVMCVKVMSNVSYHTALVEMVCCIYVFALYVGIEVVLLLCMLTFIYVLESPWLPMGLYHDFKSHYVSCLWTSIITVMKNTKIKTINDGWNWHQLIYLYNYHLQQLVLWHYCKVHFYNLKGQMCYLLWG